MTFSFRKQALRTLAAAAFALASQASTATEVLLDRIAAIVDKDVVMQSELNSRLSSIYQRLQASGTQVPSQEVLVPQVLEQLILERLQLNLASRYGVRIQDGEINQSIQRLAAAQNLSVDDFINRIHESGASLTQLRSDLRNEMMIRRVQEGVVKQNIRITPQEIDNFLSSEEGQFWKSPELQLGHILLQLSAGASKEQVAKVQAEAEQLYTELSNGADFRETAITKSAGQNALNGGDLGWRRAVQLPAQLGEAVRDGQVGEVTKPVRSDAGFHIFKIYDRRGGEQQMMVKQYNVRHILLKTNEIRDDEATYKQLESIRERINAGEEFAALSKEFSEDIGSALGGGELGWSLPGQFVPEFEQMMQSINVNEVSAPFRSQFGWHILQVTDTREQDFSKEAQQGRAAEILRDRKFQEELEVWLQELRENAFVEFKV